MTIEEFDTLDDDKKVKLIFDANKIAEKANDEANFQLFEIDNFFVESKTSLEGKFKRSFTTYSLKELPAEYVGEVLSLPIVILDNNLKAGEYVSKNKEIIFVQGR